MATTSEKAEASAPKLPDYVLDPDAVLKDSNINWRYGKAPDYSRTREFFEQTKKTTHPAASLPDLVQNLVKNWEIEASHKLSLDEWRTITSPAEYTFRVNGGRAQPGDHMLKVGTYNAIIDVPNKYYCPVASGFDGSHKIFKNMMPTFAWEVLEVYSGPPRVAFRWRHWGVMAGDYEGTNDEGKEIKVKAHGGTIEIEGVAIADVDEGLRIKGVEVFFDPMGIFKEMEKEVDVEVKGE
ncbi:hypothetical protein QBC43DRAFT_245596 [Cladorrhinum sp. PSN259]|nr:hypothetical protein QBC43DRAFT_245596 [Cladorrhinum sp. PSN259]